jgi:hypothetical protein
VLGSIKLGSSKAGSACGTAGMPTCIVLLVCGNWHGAADHAGPARMHGGYSSTRQHPPAAAGLREHPSAAVPCCTVLCCVMLCPVVCR